MKADSHTLWLAASKLVALAALALAIWTAYSGIWLTLSGAADAPIETVILAVMMVLLTVGYGWLAWRTWTRWSAATVRLLSGVAVAHAALFSFELIPIEGFEGRASSLVLSLWMLAAFLGSAFAYRKLSRAIIRWARIDDPRDLHGHPPGHMERVRAFCTILGVLTWLASQQVGLSLLRASTSGLIWTFTSILGGWTVYRVTLWRLTPPTLPALRPEGGFEVIPLNDVPEAGVRD